MLKANSATVDALTLLSLPAIPPEFSAPPPPTGLLQPFHTLDADRCRRMEGISSGKTASLLIIVTQA